MGAGLEPEGKYYLRQYTYPYVTFVTRFVRPYQGKCCAQTKIKENHTPFPSDKKIVRGSAVDLEVATATTAIDCGQGNNVAVYRLQVDSLLFSKEVEVIGQYGAEIVDC